MIRKKYLLKSLYFISLLFISNGCATLKHDGIHKLKSGEIYKVETTSSGVGGTNTLRVINKSRPVKVTVKESNNTLSFTVKEPSSPSFIDTGRNYSFTVGTFYPRLDNPNSETDIYTADQLKLRSVEPVAQAISIPIKIRSAVNDTIPSNTISGFNAAFAYGRKWNQTKYEAILNDNTTPSALDQIVGLNKTEISFSLVGFIGLNAIDLKESNTTSIEYERSALGISTGIVGLVGINRISTGFALGFDFATGKDAKNWNYQGEPWLGIVFGLDLLK